MPRQALYGSVALFVLFAAMAFDGLRVGVAWSRTGRDTWRAREPTSYWLSIGCQLAMAGLCLWCGLQALVKPA